MKSLPRPRLPRLRAWWPLAAGVLAAGGQAPVSLWWLALAGFSLLFLAQLRAQTVRRAAFNGWAFGTGYFFAALSWLVEPFMVNPAHDLWMAPFAMVFMCCGLALFWMLGTGLAKRLAPGPAWAQALAFTGALTLAEALRGWIFTGFPWALIGHGLIASPFLPLAALGGPLLLTMALLLPACAFGTALHRGSRQSIRPAATGIALLAAFALLSPMLRPEALPAGPDAAIIRLVQPNATQREKWKPENVSLFFRRQLAYTAAAPQPDLVVWPETAIPYLLNQSPGIPDVLLDNSGGVPVVFGVRRTDGPRIYNSLAVVAPDASTGAGTITDTYDKHHLVPFGEYIPFGDLMARFGITAFASNLGRGFSAGPGAHLINLPGIGPALPLICYEAVFPRDIRAAPARPAVLLQITNDAWFGTFSGPYQHLAQARLRAIEQGIPMIRVANTGISALISADGTVISSLPLGVEGYLDVALPPSSAPTPYSRSGDIPLIIIALLMMCIGAAPMVHLSLTNRKQTD